MRKIIKTRLNPRDPRAKAIEKLNAPAVGSVEVIPPPKLPWDPRIEYIHSLKEPPWDESDPHFQRSPWPKFGQFGAGMADAVWAWYDDYTIWITNGITEEDIREAYRQAVQAYKDQHREEAPE